MACADFILVRIAAAHVLDRRDHCAGRVTMLVSLRRVFLDHGPMIDRPLPFGEYHLDRRRIAFGPGEKGDAGRESFRQSVASPFSTCAPTPPGAARAGEKGDASLSDNESRPSRPLFRQLVDPPNPFPPGSPEDGEKILPVASFHLVPASAFHIWIPQGP
jgi:hypothetical protein